MQRMVMIVENLIQQSKRTNNGVMLKLNIEIKTQKLGLMKSLVQELQEGVCSRDKNWEAVLKMRQ